MPITSLAKNSARPKNFIGIHFFSPVDRMMLVEIILGKKTGDKALAMAIDYVARDQEDADRRQRHARLLRQPLRAALHVGSLQDADRGRAGADDRECRQGRRHAGRPAGADRRDGDRPRPEDHEADRSAISARRPSIPRRWQLIDTLVDKHGRFGRKNGKGFYDYPPKPAKKKLWPGLKDLYPQQRAEKVDYEELKQRFLVTIALEAARVMEEGIVTDPREADVGSILAFGFAPYTGGTLSYIDGIGAKNFVDDRQGAAEEIRRRVQGAEAAPRHGREGRDLLPALRSLCEGGESEGSGKRESGSAMYVWLRLARVAATAKAAAPMLPGSESRLSFRCLPTDIDFNLHLNNARYLMLADLGRIDIFFRTGLVTLAAHESWAPMLGGVQTVFVREIRLWQRFEVVSSIETWEGTQVIGRTASCWRTARPRRWS